MRDNLLRRLGARIAQLRKERGLKQRELAESVGAEEREISRYERGKVAPRYDRLDAIAVALGVEVRELFTWGRARAAPRAFPADVTRVALLVERAADSSPSFPALAYQILRVVARHT